MTKYKIVNGVYMVERLNREDVGEVKSSFELLKKEWYDRKYKLEESSESLDCIAETLASKAVKNRIFQYYKDYGDILRLYSPIKFNFSCDKLPEPRIKPNYEIKYRKELIDEQKQYLIKEIGMKLKEYYDKSKQQK
jgi:hypothetical protein